MFTITNHSLNQPVNNQLKMSQALILNWSLVFLIFLAIIFSITGTRFFSVTNFQNIIHLSTVLILLASAETIVIITGGIDLSVGFVMGLSSVLSAYIMQQLVILEFNNALVIIIGCMAGISVSLIPGLINGILIANYKVPPFIATLGLMGVANGITLKICKGFPIPFQLPPLPKSLVEIGNGYLFYYLPEKGLSFFNRPEGFDPSQIRELYRIFPNSLILIIIITLIIRHILKNTRFGIHSYAIGGNIDSAIRSGINIKKHLIYVYICSSLLAGLAGVFNVFQTGVGNFTPLTTMYELFAIAAVVIGGASLMGGKGRLLGSIIGVILLATLENGLTLSGVDPFFRFIAVGLILIVAVVIDRLFPEVFN